MAARVAVLDTCVLLPRYKRQMLLNAAGANLYRFHWSEDILDELVRNLSEKQRVEKAHAERVVAMLKDSFPEGLIERVAYEAMLIQLTNDAKDRHVLAAAIACGANTVVTDNVRDFPATSVAAHEIEVQTADDFLLELADRYPDDITQVVRERERRHGQPPLARDDLLAKMAVTMPRFTALMRDWLEHGPR